MLFESDREDLNLRPLGPEPSALASALLSENMQSTGLIVFLLLFYVKIDTFLFACNVFPEP